MILHAQPECFDYNAKLHGSPTLLQIPWQSEATVKGETNIERYTDSLELYPSH